MAVAAHAAIDDEAVVFTGNSASGERETPGICCGYID
jgi:hypothetical protein